MLILHALFPRGGITTPPIGQEPDPTPIPTAISLTPTQFTVRVGSLFHLTGGVFDQFGDPMPEVAVTYSSSDTSVATVSALGTVTGIAVGSATITATSGSLSATSDAIVEAAPTVTGWSDTRYPHSPNGMLFTYTDFRTSYFGTSEAGQAQKATEMDFISRKVDKVLSGGEPAGGYPVGLTHQPYILTSWIAACVHDTDYWRNPRSKTEALWLDYCAANSVDPEDGYLHYPAAATTYGMEIVSIDTNGLVTLKYDFVTYADILQNGDTVTIAGSSNAVLNGTWTISGVGVTGGAFDKNGDLTRAKTVFTIAHTGATAGAAGKVTRATDGTKTKRNRYVFLVGDGGKEFPPPRWVINHANADRIAFERDRLQKLVDGTYPDVGFTPEGFYVDEISQNTWGKFMSLVTLEYPSGGGSAWLAGMASFYATLAADWPDNPWMQEIGTGAYSKPETTTLIDSGSQCTQLEQMGNTHSRFEWVPGSATFEWVRSRVRAGAHVEFCTPYTPQDKIDGGEKAGNYANDPVPAGVRAPANIRMYASLYCVALLLNVAEKPYHIAVNVMNGHWLPENPLMGLNNRWVALFEVDMGTPTEEPARVVTSVKDTAGQGVTIAARNYERGLVVYRRIDVDWAIGTVDYAATYLYTPPASTGTDGKWCRVRSNGTLDIPRSALPIASDEGLILLPAGSTWASAVGPTAARDPTTGVEINPGDNWATIVAANPAGTTYRIKAGTHTQQAVTPKTGDTYWGEYGAIMDGENVTKKAFFSTADNVTIRNLVVKNYNCDFSDGAIRGDWTASTGWVMEYLEVTGCHGAGIYMSHSSRVSRCYVHHNGQIGLLGWAEDSVLEDSEIAFNNTDNNDIDNEAGGMKFFHAANMVVRNNYVHDNIGAGIWLDIYNYNCTIESNRVEDNTGAGIFYEISYNGIIRYNQVTRNGGTGSIARAGILISSSPNCEVYGNALSGNSNGIVGLTAVRSRSTDTTLDRGPVITKGLVVHDNATDLTRGGSGLVDQIGDGAIFADATTVWSKNEYVTHSATRPFLGQGGSKTWAEWQAAGYDADGSLS